VELLVAEGGMGVLEAVALGGTGVFVGGTGVKDGGTGVNVALGGMGVLVRVGGRKGVQDGSGVQLAVGV
jgi:hypothetical protein